MTDPTAAASPPDGRPGHGDRASIRRSAHFVPGANEKMLEKSLATEADALILDLEDAVTPENKASARATVASWLRDVDFGRQDRVVRMNPLDTEWGIADLEGTMASPPDAYLVPKISRPEEVEQIDQILTRLETEHGHRKGSVKLIVLGTETPEGLLRIRDIPAFERVEALSWGAEDLSAAIGARRNRDDDNKYLPVFEHARLMCLLAATAAGVQPFDTVYVDFRDDDGLRAECRDCAQMGFTGKITIHPAQIDIVNEAFTPTAEELAEARELLALFEKNRAEGLMAFSFKGQMVDVPHLTRAQKTVALAERLPH